MAKKESEMDEVEALRKQLAEARAPREAKQAQLEREREIARLKQEIEDEPAIAAAVVEHGAIGDKIGVVHSDEGAIVVKRPKVAAWRRFSDGETVKGKDMRMLAKECLVYPSWSRFEAITEARPAALEAVGLVIGRLAQARDKEAAEK